MIKIDFEFESKFGKFADAILFSEDTPMTEEEIEAEKQRRFTNWLALVEPPETIDSDVLADPDAQIQDEV